MKTIVVAILALLTSVATHAQEQSPDQTVMIKILGENHVDSACYRRKLALLKDAVNGKVSLALEGCYANNPDFNKATVEGLSQGTLTINRKSRLYGIDEEQAYGFGGVLHLLINAQHNFDSFKGGDPNAAQEIEWSLREFVTILEFHPDAQAVYREMFNLTDKDDWGAHIMNRINALLDARQRFVPQRVIPFFGWIEKEFYPKYRKRMEALGGRFATDKDRLARAKALAESNDPIAIDYVRFTILMRNQIFAHEIGSVVQRLRVDDKNELMVIVGRQHVEDLKRLIDEPAFEKAYGPVKVETADLGKQK